jgi:hypothetical protein
MKNKATTRRSGRRRLATVLATMGVLVMSSGAALLATAAPSNAVSGSVTVNVCHATSSDSNPYVFIQVDSNSTKLKGHLQHRQDPNKQWKSAGTFNGVDHVAGDPKADLIGDYTDSTGSHHYDGTVTEATCNAAVQTAEALADVDFFDASCANPTLADYDTSGTNVEFSVDPVADTNPSPGDTITITATAINGAVFEGGGTTQTFGPHHFPGPFDPEAPPCAEANPPGVATATVDFVDPTCDNSNAASYTPHLDNATIAVTDGSAAPGASIELTATATGDNFFAGQNKTKVITHDFPAAATDCSSVSPPTGGTPGGTEVSPPSSAVVTPTLVHAGLGDTVRNLRGTQGMVLLGLGMGLLLLAGGLGRAKA